MKKTIVVTAISVAVALAAIGYLLFAGAAGGNLQTVSNRSKSEVQADQTVVSALGRLEPMDRIIKLTAPPATQGTARLSKLFVREGDLIRENQIVAEIDGKDKLRAEVVQAEKQVGIAQSKLAQVRAGAKSGDVAAQTAAVGRLEAELKKARSELRRAESPNQPGVVPAAEYGVINRLEADLENARKELARSETLVASGDVSKSELDSRRTTVKALTGQIEEARANLQTIIVDRRANITTLQRDLERAEAQAQSVAEVRPTDVAAAAAEFENARAAVKRAQVSLAELDVKALSGGRVLKIISRPGESVSSDGGILELGETEQMFVVAEVFEEDIGKVENGQTAQMTVRSTNKVLRGVVTEVGFKIGKRSLLDTDPVADVDARVVEVRVRLNDTDSRRVANLTNLRVDVQIYTDGEVLQK